MGTIKGAGKPIQKFVPRSDPSSWLNSWPNKIFVAFWFSFPIFTTSIFLIPLEAASMSDIGFVVTFFILCWGSGFYGIKSWLPKGFKDFWEEF